jgi:hypothetical protein
MATVVVHTTFERWLVKHRLPNGPPRFEPRDTGRELVIGRPVRKDIRGATEGTSAKGPRKGSPTLERARMAICQIYPDGLPSQEIVPNAILCRRVGELLKKKPLPDVSNSTILRAAGRRK